MSEQKKTWTLIARAYSPQHGTAETKIHLDKYPGDPKFAEEKAREEVTVAFEYFFDELPECIGFGLLPYDEELESQSSRSSIVGRG